MLNSTNRKDEFSLEIERYIVEKKCTVLEALVDITEKKKLEFEAISKLLNDNLKKRLLAEAQDLKLVKKSGKKILPI